MRGVPLASLAESCPIGTIRGAGRGRCCSVVRAWAAQADSVSVGVGGDELPDSPWLVLHRAEAGHAVMLESLPQGAGVADVDEGVSSC
jgi:hypothetical protein